jgi:hypothetical protein
MACARSSSPDDDGGPDSPMGSVPPISVKRRTFTRYGVPATTRANCLLSFSRRGEGRRLAQRACSVRSEGRQARSPSLEPATDRLELVSRKTLARDASTQIPERSPFAASPPGTVASRGKTGTGPPSSWNPAATHTTLTRDRPKTLRPRVDSVRTRVGDLLFRVGLCVGGGLGCSGVASERTLSAQSLR